MVPAVLPSSLACVRHLLVMVYLLECTRRCHTEPECGCGEVPYVALTVPETNNCFTIGERFRYTCVAGYVRKAGTSNLIRCKEARQWSNATLQCIVNPLNPPPKSTVRPVTPENQTINVTPAKTGSPPPELTSTVSPVRHTTGKTSALPPLHTTETPLETTSGTSQTSDSPGSSTTSAPVSPLLSTTRRSRMSDRSTSPSDSSSLQHGSRTDTTKVIAPVAVGIVLVAVAVVGGVWFLHRRKTRNSSKDDDGRSSTEERLPMRQTDGNT